MFSEVNFKTVVESLRSVISEYPCFQKKVYGNILLWPVSMATMTFEIPLTKLSICKEILMMDLSYFEQRSIGATS